MNDKIAFRRSDGLIIFAYFLSPVAFVLGVMATAASDVPRPIGFSGLLLAIAGSISLIALPIWTIIHILQSKKRTALAILYVESVFAALLVALWVGNFLTDRQFSPRGTWLAAAAVALCIALIPLLRRRA